MIKRCEVWNIARVDGDWAGRKVLFVVYVAKVLWWLKVHYKLAMGGAPQVAMRVASQIWQIVFVSQTFQVFRLAFRKKAQYVVVKVAKVDEDLALIILRNPQPYCWLDEKPWQWNSNCKVSMPCFFGIKSYYFSRGNAKNANHQSTLEVDVLQNDVD